MGSTHEKVSTFELNFIAGIDEGNGSARVGSACTARPVNNELAVV